MQTADEGWKKALALVRMATAVFFLFFGEYKVASGAFAHGGLAGWINGFIHGEAVGWYGALLARWVLPHQVFWGYFVGVGELLIGLSLLAGVWVRPASVAGAFYMLNLTLATWFGPGHAVPWWRYLGNNLDHIPLLFLFVLFYAGRAGEKWGLDGRRK